MSGVKVELDLDEIVGGYRGYDSDGEPTGAVSLLEVILNRAAAQVVEGVGRERAYDAHRDRVADIRSEIIREKLEPLVTEALNAAVQPTDPFGEPQGEPKTLRAIIIEQAVRELTVPRQRDTYPSRHGNETLVQAFIREHIERTIGNELREEIKKARAQVMAAVRSEGAKVIAETIARMSGADR